VELYRSHLSQQPSRGYGSRRHLVPVTKTAVNSVNFVKYDTLADGVSVNDASPVNGHISLNNSRAVPRSRTRLAQPFDHKPRKHMSVRM
jgi:hypothetical protein